MTLQPEEKERALYFGSFSGPGVEDNVHFQKMHFSYLYLVTCDNKVKSVIDEWTSRSRADVAAEKAAFQEEIP